MDYHALHALSMATRTHTVRAVVQGVNDSGAEQTVDVQGFYGSQRSAVPVAFPFGFGARVPTDGAVTHVVALGGDQADLLALPPSNPSVARVGGLSEGEAVLYDAVGQKVYLKGGTIVRIDVRTSLDVRVGGEVVLQVTATGAAITGDLTVSGDVEIGGKATVSGDVTAGDVSLEGHKHSGVQSGSGTSGAPVT
ncbi:phage baseplate assembly protein [Acetobacter sp. DsW_063]|uniref:phage baseplate assembly protein domain-containing protein n=1 Tax=Acetobacter sp. DsW_063 TaxID=1514894 RepID=UPI000B638F14|nr:phage baseplate assembly protein [Acetobacter sp. DsW_063]OUJ14209.1 hypothetical protein HK28_00590 [Acetobacter sp. DsW_063]